MLGLNPSKTIQAAAYPLKLEPGKRSNYMRLLKLLYLADRKSLNCVTRHVWRHSVCNGTGPVPSTTLDMKREPIQIAAIGTLHRKIGYDVRSVDDPGNLELTRQN